MPGLIFAELLNCMVSYLKTHSLHFSVPPCGVDIKINLPLHDTANTRNLLDFADVYV